MYLAVLNRRQLTGDTNLKNIKIIIVIIIIYDNNK